MLHNFGVFLTSEPSSLEPSSLKLIISCDEGIEILQEILGNLGELALRGRFDPLLDSAVKNGHIEIKMISMS